jgi:hypothetical protein
MPAIADVVRQLGQADCPVVFLDTCVLLDIIRSIERRVKNCVRAANDLHLGVTSTPAKFQLVVSHLVHHEWGVNAPQRLLDAGRHLVAMEEQSEYFHDSCAVFGIVPGFGRAAYAAHDVAKRLHDLSAQVLNAGLMVVTDDECSGRAIRRVIHNVPPSKKGGEAKDCTILEEYLAVCRQLRVNGFQKKLVFCTSNTNDYCDKLPSSGLASVLATEFATINLDFCTSLEWAVHEASK